MSCTSSQPLCNNIIISQDVTFADDTLAINIPSGSYGDGCKYCIIIAQDIPDTTTIGATVVITIGDDTTTYPLVNCDCTNVIATQISSRTRYSTTVHTNISSGVFKLNGKAKCYSQNLNAAALPITTEVTSE